MPRSIVLVSNDGEKFSLSTDAAAQSGLCRTVLESVVGGGSSDNSDDGEGDAQQCPLPNVNGRTLKWVIDYLKHHAKHPAILLDKPLRDNIYNLGLPQFDINFIERGRTQQDIYDIIAAAMYVACTFKTNQIHPQAALRESFLGPPVTVLSLMIVGTWTFLRWWT